MKSEKRVDDEDGSIYIILTLIDTLLVKQSHTSEPQLSCFIGVGPTVCDPTHLLLLGSALE